MSVHDHAPEAQEEPHSGRTYRVDVHDCCAELHFTAMLLKVDAATGDLRPDGGPDLWDDWSQYGYEFDNGVVVPGGFHGAITLTEVPTPEWRCTRCGSARWVAASLNGGYTVIRQCVPCGFYSDRIEEEKA